MNPTLFATAPKAVIFDMDGTLLDTEPLYSIAIQRVLDDYDVQFTADLKRRTMGGDSHVSAQMVIDEFGLPLTADEYLAKREVHLRELFANVSEIEAAGDFIHALHGKGVPLGLATSSKQSLADLKLQHHSWRTCFDAAVYGDHATLHRSKPEPDIFLICAEKLGVAPESCVVFEDSPNGVLAAKRAGMRVYALINPHIPPEDLNKADHLLPGFRDLLSEMSAWQ